MHKRGFSKWTIVASVPLCLIVGCTSVSSLSANDQRIISQLTEIAPRGFEARNKVSGVECWKPSDNIIDDNQFRVLCRMHYEESGTQRYRDMICIGDTEGDRVADYCYEWAYYTDMPEFDDQPGYESSY